MEKAYFLPRLLAYIIDLAIVSLVVTILGGFLPMGDNYEKLQEENTNLQQRYLDGEVETEEFVRQNAYITYDLDRASVILYISEITVVILYFIVFQFYNHGQTFGKKLMGVRVVSNTDKELTLNDYIYRAMILNSVLVNILTIVMVLFINRDFYMYASFPLQFVQVILLLVTIFMVLSRNDRRGLHDMVGHTQVVMVK